MAKEIEFEGTIHEFPDDFTDAEIARALKSYKPVQQAAQGPSRAQLGLPQDSTGAPMPTREQLGFQPPLPAVAPDTTDWGPATPLINAVRRGIAQVGEIVESGSNAYGQLVTKAGGTAALADPGAGLVPTAYLDPATGDRILAELRDPEGASMQRRRKWQIEAKRYPKKAPENITDWRSLTDVETGITELFGENLPYMATAALTGGGAAPILGTGEIQSNLIDKGVSDQPEVAAAYGLPFAAMDVGGLAGTLLGRAGIRSATTPLRKAAVGAARGMLSEGLTEGPGQEGLALAAEATAGVPATVQEGMSRVVQSTLGGALVGGIMGSVAPDFHIDPQIAEITDQAPPPPPSPTQEELFPLEDPQAESSEEAPAAQPGQQAQTTATTEPGAATPTPPLNTPLELNIKPVVEDKETYGDFTRTFKPRSDRPAGVQIWDGENGAIVAEAQDGRYQVTTQLSPDRQGRRHSASWVFPSFDQAAWVGAYVNTMTAREQAEIADMPSEDAFEYVYTHARPAKAVVRSVNGDPLVLSNIVSTSEKRPLTFAQLDKIRSNPRGVQLMTMLDDIVSTFRNIWKSKGIPVTSLTQFIYDPAFGYGYNRNKREINVNLGITETHTYPPQGIATSFLDTIIHEFAHDLEWSHGRAFQAAHGRLTGALLQQFENSMTARIGDIKEKNAIPYLEAIHAIARLIADPTDASKVDPRILEFLRAASGGQTASLSREDSAGRSFEELLSGEPQGEADATGGSGDAVQHRPVFDAFGQGLAQPIWFSRLGNALFGPTGIYGNARQLSKQQLLAIANHPEKYGVRPEEVKWTGMKVWLDDAPAKITREDAEQWFEKHQVRVEEQVLGFTPEKQKLREKADEVLRKRAAHSETYREDMTIAEGLAYWNKYKALESEYESLMQELYRVDDPARKAAMEAAQAALLAHELTYTENMSIEASGNYWEIRNRLVRERDAATQAYYRNLKTPKFSDYTSPGPQSNYSELLMVWNGAEYKTPHFGANEVAHARFNVRPTAQGNVLFIEEIQSDWHQKGREEGYRNSTPEAKYDVFRKSTRRVVSEGNTLEEAEARIAEDDDLDYEINPTWVASSQPPAAPFANSWHELALKRLIRWAVDKGLDGIAWTPARMQVERYEDALRQVIKGAKWTRVEQYLINKEVQPVVSFQANGGAGPINFLANTQGKILASGIPEFVGKSLQEVVGADLAVRILNEPSGVWNGEAIIGGEQYRILYDQEIPKFLQKYLKQWGIELGRTNITASSNARYDVQESYQGRWQVWDESRPEAEDAIAAFDTEEEAQSFKEKLLAENALAPVPFFALNDSIRESARRGQPLLRDLPPEARIFGQQLEKALDESGAIEDEIDNENREQTHADLDHFWVGSKLFSTVQQNGFLNKHIPQLQNFLEHLREFVAERNTWKYEGEKILKDWNRLGKAQMSALSNFLFDVTAESDKLRRRLTLEELAAFSKKHNLGEDAERVYHGIDATFRSVLEALREEELRRIKARVGESNVDVWAIEQGKLNKEFEKVLNRNYFPYARFGNHVVLAVANEDTTIAGRKYRKGNTVHMSTYSSRREMRAMEKLLKKQMAGVKGVTVGTRWLPDTVMDFQGFPAHLYKQVVETLQLSEEQADTAKRFFLNLTPSQSFIHHLRKRRSIGGFSTDAQRVFSHYLSSAAGHVSRAKHGDVLKADLSELKGSAKQAFMETGQGELRDKIASYAEKAYKHAMNPGEDFGTLRGLIFAHYFAFVPTQAAVNLMQLPMMTYPHLLVKYGPTKSAKALVQAMYAVTSGFNFNGTVKWSQWDLSGNINISPEAKRGLERGIKAGFINESFAVEVASLSNGNILEAMLPYEIRNVVGIDNFREAGRIVRDAIELGTAPFRLSEEWNRRVAFLAAFNLEMEQTQNAESAFKEGRETVDQTMYEYASWNRPEIARNKAGILFVFKSFLQSSLWYYMNGRGRIPALVMLAAVAGLEGLPGAEDLMEIITWLTSDRSMLGTSGKRIDPRKIARLYLQTIMDDPDIVMHGAARRSLGLGYISGMPGWDLSPKLGVGRIVPGLVPAAQGARGEMTGKDAVARMAEEWIGVAGTMGMNAARAAVDNGPQGIQWKMAFYPAAVRNIVRTIQSTNQGALVDGRGEPLVRVDQTDPTQLVEVLGQSLGLRPTRLATNQEANYRASQENAFFIARQQHLMSQLESALLSSNRDQEAVAEARRAIKTYNETMPPQFRMSASQIIESLKRRSKGNALRERGLPTQKAFRQIQQEWKSVYPTQ